jgi:hypothetical protein
MPFPLAAVLPVESERWSCLSCRLQLLVLLHNDLLTGCGCASALISILKKTLAVKSTRLVCSLYELGTSRFERGGQCYQNRSCCRRESSSRYPFSLCSVCRLQCGSLQAARGSGSETDDDKMHEAGSGTGGEQSRFRCIADRDQS